MKAFIEPFEAPQKSVKIKIYDNFFPSSGIETGRVNELLLSPLTDSEKIESTNLDKMVHKWYINGTAILGCRHHHQRALRNHSNKKEIYYSHRVSAG